MDFDQVMQLLTLAAVVLAFWWTNQAFPPGPTAQLISELRKGADTTPNKVDDALVEIAALLNQIRVEQAGIDQTPQEGESPV